MRLIQLTPTGLDVRAMSAFLSFLRHSSVDEVVRVGQGSSDGSIVDHYLDHYDGDMQCASMAGPAFPLQPGVLPRLRGGFLWAGLCLGMDLGTTVRCFVFVMDQFTLRFGVPSVDLLVSVSSYLDCLYQHASSEWFSFTSSFLVTFRLHMLSSYPAMEGVDLKL